MATDYITKRLDGVLFSFYSAEEVRKLSVVEISNPVSFDALNKPLRKGLYDPAMGISPYDKNSRCITCGHEGLNCPGHIGHVELAVPVFNPLNMKYLMRVLKAMCFSCHKIRIPAKRMDEYCTMLILIKLGYVTEKEIYQDALTRSVLRKAPAKGKKESASDESHGNSNLSTKAPSSAQSRNNSRKQSDSDIKIETEEDMDFARRPNKQTRDTIRKLLNIKSNPNFKICEMSTGMVKALRDTIQDIWSSVASIKCPHCEVKPPSVKLDMNTKVLLETRDEKQVSNILTSSEKGYKEDPKKDKKKDEDGKNPDEKKEKTQTYLSPFQVRAHLEELWKENRKLLDLIFGNLIVNQKTLENTKKGFKIMANNYNTFFIEALAVPPNRFRPENKMNDMTFLHEHTVMLTKVLEINGDIKKILITQKNEEKDGEKNKKKEVTKPENDERTKLTDTIRMWINLQDAVNCFIDSSKASKFKDKEGSGIRQLLERKEGLFRMKMMGKRVNYSARSVISPDPYINTNEVGVPMYAARTLTFPESVNEYNVEKLRKLVINGAYKWPGANYVEENGVKIALDTRNEAQRQALAKMLMHNYRNKVVYRHLKSGDVLLFNRQPTLHKSSIMSHIARVLPKENTIRNHYANCKTYNADFDGDEMNLHLLQNHLARAEAYTISNTANQYISPTTGKPLRGLIQDSVISAFFLTNRGTLLSKDEYQQLVYMATWNIIAQNPRAKIIILPPAILKPKRMWTGKQVISSIIKTIVGSEKPGLLKDGNGLNMDAKAKVKFSDATKKKILVEDPVTKTSSFKEVFDAAAAEESDVILRDNELLQGVVDANQIGSAESGIVHSFYELYGGKLTEILITCVARVMTCYLQLHGFTCSMDDLVTTEKHNLERREIEEQALRAGVETAAKWAGVPEAELHEDMNLNNRSFFNLNSNGVYDSKVLKRESDVNYLSPDHPIVQALQKKLVLEKNAYKDLDNAMKPTMGKHTSGITSTLIPAALCKSFPSNYFSAIIQTGAKGSNVNQNQVSALLGQQELEGRRVPVLPSGKTLPSFIPYDPNPRAWGYITDRFLSGVRCQDFYFHCMAGREGLIDTAVKTSVSGYLQRCLIKNMEPLVVNYDFTVRDGDGSVVQFYYGEDGLDPTKTKYLTNFKFLEKNFSGYVDKYDPASLATKLNQKAVKEFTKERAKNPEAAKDDTVLNHFLPGSYLHAMSESVINKLAAYNVDPRTNVKKRSFQDLVGVKYFNTLIHPGECVGVLAGQAIGEPSTQMTLNTFHLAGHSGANVTMGIPRLREILFRGSGKVKAPMMTLTLERPDGKDLKKPEAEKLARKMQRLKLIELVQSIQVREIKHLVEKGRVLDPMQRQRLYEISITFEDIEAIKASFDISFNTIKNRIENLFLANLLNKVAKELKKTKHSGADITVQKADDSAGAKKSNEAEDDVIVESDDEKDDKEEQPAKNTKPKPKTGSKPAAGKQSEGEKPQEERPKAFENAFFKKLSYKEEGNNYVAQIVLKVPLDSKKLLMLNLVESVISDAFINSTPGIMNCFLTSDNKEVNGVKKEVFKIITEGLNFNAMFNFDFIHKNSLHCNDVSEVLKIYGVEAARRAIINEVVSVFKPYGINVDFRHLSLIADVMTYDGGIRTLTSRGVIRDSVSPLQKMSFEMASRFLTESAMVNEYDALKSASSQIVLGRPPNLGSGMFEIHHKLVADQGAGSDDEGGMEEEA